MVCEAVIDLEFNQNELAAELKCCFRPAVRQFTFNLNSLLEVDQITSDSISLRWHKQREQELVFRARSSEIRVEAENGFNNLTIRYHGKISGWCNILEENRKALSFYSVWYPQETSVALPDIIIRIHGLCDYFILNAEYDWIQKTWTYGGRGYDTGNIIALKRGHYAISNEGVFSLYYLSREEAEAGDYLKHYFQSVSDYYQNNLFQPKEIKKIDVVSLLLPEASGAYFRKELIVLSQIMGEDYPRGTLQMNLAYLMAHELGHNWCSGADCSTWEDWLNETTAEWSSLLYAWDRGDSELFTFILDSRSMNYTKCPPIRTADGSRPEGVHQKGTVLFYEIFKEYGEDVVREMLRTFVSLEEKTTKAFLMVLREKVGEDIADTIERGLSLQTYENLFKLNK